MLDANGLAGATHKIKDSLSLSQMAELVELARILKLDRLLWLSQFYIVNFKKRPLHQGSGANLEKLFFAEFYTNFHVFSSFFQLFCTTNAGKAYFDQPLECTAPKHWLEIYNIRLLF